MRFQEKAEESLGKVLDFYKKQGFGPAYTPRIRVVDDFLLPPGSFVIWSDYKNFAFEKIKSLCSEVFLIKPDEEKIKKIIKKYSEPLQTETGIIYFTIGDYRTLEAQISHETWHLIEEEKGIISLTPLIIEGTAHYAEAAYTCVDPLKMKGVRRYRNHQSYKQYLSVKKTIKNIHELLDPEKRRIIQNHYVKHNKGGILKENMQILEWMTG